MENVIGTPNAKLRHQGKRAFIYGKGPSFSDYSLRRDGSIHICVNETAIEVAHPDYAFFTDGNQITWETLGVLHAQSPGTVICLPWTVINGECYADNQFLMSFKRSISVFTHRGEYDILLWTGCSTLHTAIHFAWWTGIDRVRLVGVDGGDGVSEKQCDKWPLSADIMKRIARHPDRRQQQVQYYRRVRQMALGLCGVLEMEVKA